MRRTRLLATAILILPGCAMLDKIAPPPAAVPAPVRVATPASTPIGAGEELIAYLARLKSLSESALNTEATRQRQLAQRDTSDVTRVKAALALTLANQVDEADILAIVDPIAKKEGRTDPDVRAVAGFLQGIAQERRRSKESAAAAGNRLRDALRARDTEKQRADALQERAAQLQQKLDALTDLEKSLSDRPTPPR